jgi:glycosyltransferase involved in cell wall biosynthesis
MVIRKEAKIDCIICYDPIFTGPIGVVAKFLLNCKLIVGVSTDGSETALNIFKENLFRKEINRIFYRVTTAFSFMFSEGIYLLSKKFINNLPRFARGKKIFVFHDYVPTHYYEDVFSSQQISETKDVLFVGSPFNLKGVDALIKSFNNIKDVYGLSLSLVGHRLKEDADRERVVCDDKRINFISPMTYDKLKEYFRKAYCFVLPSWTEGLPRVVLEAMASGKPIIASDVGANSDLVKDGVNGFLFKPGDVNSLTVLLRKVLSDEALARSMGEKSREIVVQEFSSKIYCEKFKQMLDDLIGV